MKLSLPLPVDEDPQQPLQVASPTTSEYESATDRSHGIQIPKLDLNDEPGSSGVDEYGTDEVAITARTHQSADGHQTRTPKFAWIRRYLSFRGVFHLFGRSVAMYPQAYLIVSFLIASLSYGMRYMVLKDQIRDGYTPTNAPSRFETDVMREFWNASGDPIMTVVLIQAKDNGSMLRPDYFNEAIKLHKFLLHNFTFDYENEKVKYDQLCSPYCGMNMALDIFYDGLEKQLKLLKQGKSLDDEIKLLFPVSEIDGFTVHLERNFFGMKLKEKLNDYEKYVGKIFGNNESIDGMMPYQAVTNIEKLMVIMMIFRGDRTNPRKGDMLSKWELEVYDWSLKEYGKNDSKFEVYVIGTEVLDQEMIRDGQRLTPFFAAGFGLMFTFVFITVLGTAYYYDELDWGKVVTACAACFS
uniref:Uncharacterized protein n=1 Tax=Panagrolaimus sp. JU765 TaxID=591449 RepID=A0AC34RCR7_9BILA